MPSTASVTTLLLPSMGGYDNPLGEILGADSSATTYLLKCNPIDPEEFCDNDITLTIGPWADKTLAPSVTETGEMGMHISGEDFGMTWDYSLHCEMSRSIAQECVRVIIDDEGTRISTYTEDTQLQKVFGPTFDYATPTITAGLDKLTISETNSPPGETILSSSTGPGPEETGGRTASADEPENTNGVASRLPGGLGVVFAVGLATGIIL